MFKVAARCLSIIILTVAVVAGCVWLVRDMERSYQEMHERTVQEGRDAYKAEVPAEANPYTNWPDRRRWLRGWMEEQREAAEAAGGDDG